MIPKKLKLKEFKIIRNKERPDFCYMYELEISVYRFRILTMNHGFSYTASIEKHTPTPRLKHQRTTLFYEKFDFKFLAIDFFREKIKELQIF